ncbi:alcohol dehydrogenase catalytic domain-containing protein [Gloeocapsopsis dulcis]|uniref:alcohol dehydrogenase catalytic domain-containing protein n=1 Tax=Gloeocapsopsis dulcis TaxID=2859516 RepID=UPI001F2BB098|nr:alcohol dehydrogenase catalytic domain-containing protein [Gloeocapsopsis dulcis]WNN90113.1 alcohol dehydrogenase catalytic domain-containing protein [Gloeocapsopsis dulcis]
MRAMISDTPGKLLRVANLPKFKVGDRVGVPGLGHTCHHCRYCLSGKENLYDYAQFTLVEANDALDALRSGKINGAAVLVVTHD